MAKKKGKQVKVPAEPAPEVSEPIKKYAPRERALHLTDEEMTMAALVHASVVLGFVSGGLAGIATALVIWLIYKDKSRYVAFQAMQALVSQLALTAVTIAAVLSIVVSFITICLIPLGLVLLLAAIALPFAELIYGLYAAYETYYGADFMYWQIGEFVERHSMADWGKPVTPAKEEQVEEEAEAEPEK